MSLIKSQSCSGSHQLFKICLFVETYPVIVYQYAWINLAFDSLTIDDINKMFECSEPCNQAREAARGEQEERLNARLGQRQTEATSGAMPGGTFSLGMGPSTPSRASKVSAICARVKIRISVGVMSILG